MNMKSSREVYTHDSQKKKKKIEDEHIIINKQ